MPKPLEILLIEDSLSDANLTIERLSRAQVATAIHWVEDGESGIEFLKRRGEFRDAPRPDLILLDLNLPGLDGHEVLADVKTDPTLQRIPIVVLTTSDDETDVVQSYDLMANCYITKPISIQKFLDIVGLIETFWLTTVKLPQ